MIRSDENVEAHEPNWTASGRHEEEERSFVVQKLAWYSEALVDCLERGKNFRLTNVQKFRHGRFTRITHDDRVT